MAILFSGDCIGRAVNVQLGGDKNGKPKVQWEMEVTEGEHKGKRAQYSGKFDADNIKWTKSHMKLIGWQGSDVRTFVDDVAKANLTIAFTAEVAEYERPDGTVSRWTSAKMTGALPLSALDAKKLDDVNRWFSEAEEIAPPGEAHPNAPGADSDIPF